MVSAKELVLFTVVACHTATAFVPHVPTVGRRWIALRSESGEEAVSPDVPSLEESMSPEELLKYMVDNMIDLEGNEHLLPEIDSEAVMAAEEAERAESGVYGDMAGLDDPRDVPWRLKAEELVRGAVVTVPDAQVYDITWNIADLIVTLEGDNVGIDLIVDVNKAIQAALDPFEVFYEGQLCQGKILD